MTFTFAHGLAASLVLHGAVLLPFALPRAAEPPKDTVVLVLELQGIEAETQNAQQLRRQARGAAEQAPRDEVQPEPVTQATETPAAEERQAAHAPPPQAPSPPRPPEETAPEGTQSAVPPTPPAPPSPTPMPSPSPTPPPQAAEQAPVPDTARPAPSRVGDPGAANVTGAREEKQAQTLARAEAQSRADRLRDYVKGLSRKVQDNLVYPPSGRKTGLRGTARVAFTLEADGSIRPGSLAIAESSGQPALDANALKTIAASAPFEPPPRPISISIAVTYGRRS